VPPAELRLYRQPNRWPMRGAPDQVGPHREPDRGLLGAELINRAGAELGDALLGSVLALVLQGLLGGLLPASGQQECSGTTSGDCDGAGGAYRVQLRAGTAIAPQQHDEGCRTDPEHDRGTPPSRGSTGAARSTRVTGGLAPNLPACLLQPHQSSTW